MRALMVAGRSMDELWRVAEGKWKYSDYLKVSISQNLESSRTTFDIVKRLSGIGSTAMLKWMNTRCILWYNAYGIMLPLFVELVSLDMLPLFTIGKLPCLAIGIMLPLFVELVSIDMLPLFTIGMLVCLAIGIMLPLFVELVSLDMLPLFTIGMPLCLVIVVMLPLFVELVSLDMLPVFTIGTPLCFVIGSRYHCLWSWYLLICCHCLLSVSYHALPLVLCYHCLWSCCVWLRRELKVYRSAT